MQQLIRPIDDQPYPIKIIQFGEGNFLRAFIDWMVDLLNQKAGFNASVAVVQPLKGGMINVLNEQGGYYHHIRQGIENNEPVDELRLIKCLTRGVDPYADFHGFLDLAKEPEVKLIFSNTTEAGITFDPADQPEAGQLSSTFPGKLTQLLYQRFTHYDGDPEKGVCIIPCELIEQNGTKLKACIRQYILSWKLPADFEAYFENACSFANTLVDRIVPGYPKDDIDKILQRIGYKDKLVVKSESFHLFVIQGPEGLKELFPAAKHGFNVKHVADITPYRTQKVRILNGAHTAMVPIGLLYNLETVREVIDDPETGKLVREIIFDEIVPTISIPGEDPAEFAREVINRFKNPFIRHELITISLNSISKFKVRVLPTILDYYHLRGQFPHRLTFSFASLIHLYLKDGFALQDNGEFLGFFKSLRAEDPDIVVQKVLSNTVFWDQDLSRFEGLKELMTAHLQSVTSAQMKEAILNI